MGVSSAFIVVFRPQQRAAWAESFQSEQDFVEAFLRGDFDRSCNCSSSLSASPSFNDVLNIVSNDLYCVTILDSAEECKVYVEKSEYCGRHNKGINSVVNAALEIGWFLGWVVITDAENTGLDCAVFATREEATQALDIVKEVFHDLTAEVCKVSEFPNTTFHELNARGW